MQKYKNGNRIKVPFRLPDRDDVVLERYCDDKYGFMLFHLTSKILVGKFFTTTSPYDLRFKAAKKIDVFELDLERHKLK
jgi:hypothetical protein